MFEWLSHNEFHYFPLVFLSPCLGPETEKVSAGNVFMIKIQGPPPDTFTEDLKFEPDAHVSNW